VERFTVRGNYGRNWWATEEPLSEKWTVEALRNSVKDNCKPASSNFNQALGRTQATA